MRHIRAGSDAGSARENWKGIERGKVVKVVEASVFNVKGGRGGWNMRVSEGGVGGGRVRVGNDYVADIEEGERCSEGKDQRVSPK